MPTRCSDCSHSFLLTPDGMTQAAACPNCGGTRLERDQPNPTNSDGDMSASNPGLGINQQGIPEQEGIWGQTDGGWQTYKKRDESFASVKTAAITVQPHPEAGIHYGPLSLIEKLKSVNINGIPVTPENREELFSRYALPSSGEFGQPVQVTAHHPEFENLAGKIIESGTGDPQFHREGAMALQNLVRSGQVPPPGAPQVVGSRLSFDDFDFGIDFDKTPTHKFIVDPTGRVLSGHPDGTHEQIAVQNRLSNFPKGYSLGQLHDDGSTEWYQHETRHSPQALESMLYGHFGKPVQIDPNLKPSTNEERWGLVPGGIGGPPDPRGRRELDVLRDKPLPRSYGYPLDENEGLVRGGRTLNQDPYMPWTHESFVLPAMVPALLGGEAAAGAAGGGLLGGLMGGAMRGVGFNAVKGLIPGQGGEQPAMGPQSVPPPRDEAQLSHVTADIETPHTNPGYHDSPDGDTHQFKDDSSDPAAQNPNTQGEAGGAATGEDNVEGGIGANQPTFSPGSMETAKLLLPKILDYYHSENSGAEDPQLKALHEQLEQESPGYMDQGDPEAVEAYMQKLREPSAVQASVILSAVREAFDWNQAPDTADVRPQGVAGDTGQCAYCGGQVDPSGTCSTCGAQAPSNPQAAQQAIQQLPQQGQPSVAPPGNAIPKFNPGFTPMPGYTGKTADAQPGHCGNCGGVLDADGTCNQCGAANPAINGNAATPINSMPTPTPGSVVRVAHDHQGPVTDEQKAAVSQLLIEEGRHNEIPQMLQEPWNYSRELAKIQQNPNVAPNVDPNEQPPPAPVQEQAPPGATMPVPNPADPSMQGQMVSKVADLTPPQAPQAPQEASPEAPQDIADPNATQDQPDSTQTWQDQGGQPLVEGQTYELHSPKYQIPDIVQIVAVKPDSIEVNTIGEENPDPSGQDMTYKHEIGKGEADLYQYTFEPAQGGQPEPTPEQAQDDGQPSPVNTEPVTTPDIQHQHSHVEASEETPDPDEYCPRCATAHISSAMSSPTTTFHECYKCAHTWETKEEDYIDNNTAGREWIKDSSGPGGDDFWDGYDKVRSGRDGQQASRSLADIASRDSRYQEIKNALDANAQERTAGKKFTPSEQREFINEQGVARNADKLDLEGTHYQSHRYLGDKANGMNAPDEHLFMGW